MIKVKDNFMAVSYSHRSGSGSGCVLGASVGVEDHPDHVDRSLGQFRGRVAVGERETEQAPREQALNGGEEHVALVGSDLFEVPDPSGSNSAGAEIAAQQIRRGPGALIRPGQAPAAHRRQDRGADLPDCGAARSAGRCSVGAHRGARVERCGRLCAGTV